MATKLIMGVSSLINEGGIYLSANYEKNRRFLIALYHLILRIPNLEVASKRIFHQQVNEIFTIFIDKLFLLPCPI